MICSVYGGTERVFDDGICQLWLQSSLGAGAFAWICAKSDVIGVVLLNRKSVLCVLNDNI